MMVQRVLSCENLKSAQKAMIGSGFFVLLQFSIFLFAGSLIWQYMDGVPLLKDREFSTFVLEYLPLLLELKLIFLRLILYIILSLVALSF